MTCHIVASFRYDSVKLLSTAEEKDVQISGVTVQQKSHTLHSIFMDPDYHNDQQEWYSPPLSSSNILADGKNPTNLLMKKATSTLSMKT